MPYLLLIIGIILAAAAFLHWFAHTTPRHIRWAIKTAAAIIFGLALLALALTGRLYIALIALAAMVPFVIAIIKDKEDETEEKSSADESPDALPPPEDDTP